MIYRNQALASRNVRILSLFAMACALPCAAQAQRTDDNAAASAEDAFGRTVGNSSIGIYTEGDVRGFSPVDAGNLRIEGLYYDQQGLLTARVLEGTTIRVGISAQSYPFPAPTGIADYSLRKPGDEAVASFVLTHGPRPANFVEADFKLPLDGSRLGIAGGIGWDRDRRPYGGTPNDLTTGLIVRYAPQQEIELLAFTSRFRNTDNEAQPLIFTAGDYLPTRFRRGRFLGQDWNDYSATFTTHGAIAKLETNGWRAQVGLFRSIFDNDVSTADLLFGTDRSGHVGQRIIVREREDRFASTSGEVRAEREIREGPRAHSLTLSYRYRKVDRRYGGGALIDLGPSSADRPDPRPYSETVDGTKSLDLIRQYTPGIAYRLSWKGLGELSANVQKTRYSKRVTDPGPQPNVTRSRSAPWLPSLNAALRLTKALALYGGFARGLEESPVAPVEAANRNDAPPAIRTEQVDGGFRLALGGHLTAVAGAFSISKPYYNLDRQNRFRRLGAVRNRGLEFSVAGQPWAGGRLVAGTVLLDARISGEEVDSSAIGRRPVGSAVRRSVVSLEQEIAAVPGLSLDVVADSASRRVANSENNLFVPGRTNLSLGARYRFSIREDRFLVRAQVQNVTNGFSWNVDSSGYFTPNAARSYSIVLAADL